MNIQNPLVTYIGGPTALIEIAGVRFLTDPTFDSAGSEYTTAVYTLRKTADPAITADALGPIDAVLLSHDHHFDNLDRSGRAMLPSARAVLTTKVGAERLGRNAVGLANWDSVEIATPNGERLRVTGTPARHGPADGDRGPVTGFLINDASAPAGPTTTALNRLSFKSCESPDAPAQGLTMIAVSAAALIARASEGLATLTSPAPMRSAPRAASLAAPVACAGPLTTTQCPLSYL